MTLLSTKHTFILLITLSTVVGSSKHDNTDLKNTQKDDPPTSSSTNSEKNHLIMLNPEQVQILKEAMPGLPIKTSTSPIEVTPAQLDEIKRTVAETHFKLPPGFPEEFVNIIQSAVKAKPKIVRKTVVTSKTQVDDDPMEFVRKLSSYKREHGLDTDIAEPSPPVKPSPEIS